MSRLVVLPEFRGAGASAALLSACAAAHDIGVACRIATRKADVADRALAKLACLARDDRRARAAGAEPRSRALTVFDPAATPEAFRTTTAEGARDRGKNRTFAFWFVGADLLEPGTGARFRFVGGAARFAPAPT